MNATNEMTPHVNTANMISFEGTGKCEQVRCCSCVITGTLCLIDCRSALHLYPGWLTDYQTENEVQNRSYILKIVRSTWEN